jgi:hypothetical protein
MDAAMCAKGAAFTIYQLKSHFNTGNIYYTDSLLKKFLFITSLKAIVSRKFYDDPFTGFQQFKQFAISVCAVFKSDKRIFPSSY